MTEPERPATSEAFAYKYRRLTTPPAREVRRAVLGSAVPNGYTTVGQAERLASVLDLAPGRSLLDLGSGRGWPGSRIAEVTGCDLVLADLPLDALRSALEHVAVAPADPLPPSRRFVVCADGFRLPFRDRSFDAASHTDVLC